MARVNGEGLEAGLLPLQRRLSSIARADPEETIPIDINVCDLCVEVGPKKDPFKILKNVNTSFKSGRFICVMGPSGSGKTTLLSCLLGINSARIKGHILVNGIPGPPPRFKNVAKLVPQEDVLLTSLTVRECLQYQADLVMPQSYTKEKKEKRINRVIEILSLTKSQNTRIGNIDHRGISGGERKRTSIAMDLLSNPCILFVDEPTSGLDSKTAEDVCSILRNLAHGDDKAAKKTVIATIHQPNSRIFNLFDDVLLLSDGKVAYSGPVKDIEDYFVRLNMPSPLKENPADHYMRMLQDDEPLQLLTDQYNEQADSSTVTFNNEYIEEQRELLKKVEQYPTSQFWQFTVLFRRNIYDAFKDPTKFVRGVSLKLAVGLMIGTVWYKKADPPLNENIFPMQGALFILTINSVIETLAQTIISFPIYRALLIREYRNGSYSLVAYYVAMMLAKGLLGIVFVFAIVLPIYFMVGLQLKISKFLYFVSLMICMTCIGNALGVAVGATSADLISAQNKLMPTLAPLILFSGYVLPKDQIPKYFVWLYDISFFQYGINAMLLNQFTGLEFEDFNIFKLHIFKTGEQYLKTIGMDPDTHHIENYLGILAGYAVAITFMGYWIIKFILVV